MAHISKIVPAEGEQPGFAPGDRVRVGVRFPIGHYRVPHYIRGKTAVIERVIEPAVNNEEEGFGRNAGSKLHYYRIVIPMTKLWPGYAGSARLEALGAELIGKLSYYERWIVAFANILFEKSILTLDQLARKMDEVSTRFNSIGDIRSKGGDQFPGTNSRNQERLQVNLATPRT
jgi:nitrile hydratase